MKDFQQLKILLQKANSSFWEGAHRFEKLHPILFLFIMTVVLLSGLFFLNIFFQKQAIALTPLTAPFVLTKDADYPVLERKFLPAISADAAFIMDNSSKVILFAKNDTVRFSPASTTKMMTALVALDYYHMDDILVIKRSNVEPVVVGFPKGAKVRFEDMLYGMLLPSGNDAALAIADNYPGGESAFVSAMNAKAKLFHMTNTHFGDPVGLLDDEDYSTVREMAILASFAISHPEIAKIVNTKSATIHDSTGTAYQLHNTNKLLGLYGVNGIKTGFTGEAGEVLATSAVINGRTFIIIVMRSEDRFADTEKLLQLLQENVTYMNLHP